MKPIRPSIAAAALFSAGATGFRYGAHYFDPATRGTLPGILDFAACVIVAFSWFWVGRRTGLFSAGREESRALNRMADELGAARADLARAEQYFGRCDDCGEIHPFPVRRDPDPKDVH